MKWKERIGVQAGDTIRISGDVKYGNKYYRIASNGVIEDIKSGAYCLCTVENIDGDGDVCINVLKKYIHKLETENSL